MLPMKIFPRYIPRELQWKIIIKTKLKKYDDVLFIPIELILSVKSVGKIIGKLLTSP